jgi:hypothetical protein
VKIACYSSFCTLIAYGDDENIYDTKKEIFRQTKPLYHSSQPSIAASTTIGQDHKKTPLSDRGRSELVHKEEKSFWRSWFGLGSSFDSDSDSDDEKRKKTDSKFNQTNSNRPHGPKLTSLSTRKSSAERQTNFNAPTEEEKAAAKLAKSSRSSSVRAIR